MDAVKRKDIKQDAEALPIQKTKEYLQRKEEDKIFIIVDNFNIVDKSKDSKRNFDISFDFNKVFSHDGLENLRRVIDKSKIILTLKEDWDTLGSEGYEQITWDAMRHFLLDYAKQIKESCNTIIDSPKIYPGPCGSIDIYWDNNKGTILINIAKGGKRATYYADYMHGDNQQKTEGEFDPHSFTYKLLPIANF